MSSRLTALVLFMVILHAASPVVHAETVTIAGSGGMIPLLTDLGNEYMRRNPHDVIRVNPRPLTQSGGILAAKTGAVDIGMSARPLEPRELNFSIEEYYIADLPAEVAVHHSVGIRSLTTHELCAIYGGEITNWRQLGGRDAQIVVLTRPDSDSTKQAFREAIPCMRHLAETTQAKIMYRSNDMIHALRQTPDAIGLIESPLLERSFGKCRAVSLDGKTATAEAIAKGDWPVVMRYTLIVRNDRSKAVNRFIRFIKSPVGASTIRKHDGIPLNFDAPS